MTDPLFDPFIKKSVGPTQPNHPDPNVGTASSGPAGQPSAGQAIPKNVGRSGIASSSQSGPKTLLVLRDAMGGMGFVGPFDDEDAAMDYVKDNNLNGAYWVLITDLAEP